MLSLSFACFGETIWRIFVCNPLVAKTHRLPVALAYAVGQYSQHVVRHDHHARPEVPG